MHESQNKGSKGHSPDPKVIQLSPLKSRKLEQEHKVKVDENTRLRQKVKELGALVARMRKGYHKELQHYKELDHLKNSKTKGGSGKNQDSIFDDEEEQMQLQVELFDAIEGLDEEVLAMVNQKILRVKEQYQDKIRDHITYQTSLLKKIYLFNKLSPNAYSIINLSLEEVFRGVAQVESDPNRVWKQLNEAYGTDYFIGVIERVYGKRFARDYDALYTEVDKVKAEAKYHIDKISKQSDAEIQALRRQVDERIQENNHIKER